MGETVLDRRGTVALTAAGLSLIAVCYGLARFAYGMFLPAFRADFGLDAAAAGTIAAGSYVAYCLAIVISTVLTPRLGARCLSVVAGFLATMGTLLITLAPDSGVLALGVIVAGSSTGVASPPLAHAVAGSVRAGIRARVQTVINAGTGLGIAVAGPIALVALDQWRPAWLAFSLICASVTFCLAWAVPQPQRTRIVRAALVPRPAFPPGSTTLMLAAVLMGIASSAVWTFGRDLLEGVGGMSSTASALAWICLGACGMLGAASGDLARRIGARRGWRLCMLGLAAATLIFGLAPGSIGAAWSAAALFGAVYIALTGLLLVRGTEVYRKTPAAGVGLGFLLLALGQAAGTPVIGALITAVSPVAAFVVAAVIAVLGSAFGPARTAPPPGRSR